MGPVAIVAPKVRPVHVEALRPPIDAQRAAFASALQAKRSVEGNVSTTTITPTIVEVATDGATALPFARTPNVALAPVVREYVTTDAGNSTQTSTIVVSAAIDAP